MGAWLVLLLAQTGAPSAAAAEPPIPLWGWITIVSGLASAVVSLAIAYAKARDGQVEAEKGKTALALDMAKQTSVLLERAIEAFTTSKLGTEQVVELLQDSKQEIRELAQEVRRGEKGPR